MSILDEKVKQFAKPASSVKHSGRVAYVVSRADLTELDSTIEPKIKQNKAERKAAWIDGKDKIINS